MIEIRYLLNRINASAWVHLESQTGKFLTPSHYKNQGISVDFEYWTEKYNTCCLIRFEE